MPAAGALDGLSRDAEAPAVPPIGPSRAWVLAGVVAALVFVFAFGRGIPL